MSEFRIEVPHTREADYHHWVWLPGWDNSDVSVRRDHRGYKHPHSYRSWVVLICNNTECAGRAIIRADVLENIANFADPMIPDPS